MHFIGRFGRDASSVRFVVRFDDVCPTMNWHVWEKVERILISTGIRPIVAVVPDNRDPKLEVGPPCKEFWARVRDWKARGWTIGWHGFQHLYETKESGLLGLNSRSEFAGLTADVQRRKLEDAHAIFVANGVRPEVWVAPGHSFDKCTVELLQRFGVRAISDGFYFRPVIAFGSLWIPQQLWNFRRIPVGLWTVCYHVNGWSDVHIQEFANHLREFGSRVTSIADVLVLPHRKIGMIDRAFSSMYRHVINLKRSVSI